MFNSDVPQVSVIIPTYNHGHFIQDAIQSVFGQTYRSFELIVVNDGSSDETDSILEALQGRASGKAFQVLHQNNQGVAAARNAGAAVARGKYLLFLDGDDELKKTYLEKTVPTLESRQDLGYVYTAYERFGTIQGVVVPREFHSRALLLENYITVTSLMRREVFNLVGGFRTSLHLIGYEDWDFFLSALEHHQRGALVPEALFRYRQHAVSRNQRAVQNSRAVKTIRHLHPSLFDAWYYVQYYLRVLHSLFLTVRSTHP